MQVQDMFFHGGKIRWYRDALPRCRGRTLSPRCVLLTRMYCLSHTKSIVCVYIMGVYVFVPVWVCLSVSLCCVSVCPCPCVKAQNKNKTATCSLHQVMQFGIINSENQLICTEYMLISV